MDLFYNDVSCLPDQQAKLDFYSAMSLKQQSKDRRVAPNETTLYSRIVNII
jgi:hypothetical protein